MKEQTPLPENASQAMVPYGGQGRLLSLLPEGSAEALILGFHGYGEDAAVMLERLTGLDAAQRCAVAALEAPNLFYARAGRIGASWMTRRGRLEAIAGLLDYVERALESLAGLVAKERPLVLAGFSQGAALAARVAASGGPPVRGLILLGGELPPELAADSGRLARLPSLLLARGRKDALYGESLWHRDGEALERAGLAPRLAAFEGGHEWNEAFRREADAFLVDLLS